MGIGVGLIGYGLAGRYLHAPFFSGAGFDLKAVATSRAGEVSQDFPSADVVPSASEVIGRSDGAVEGASPRGVRRHRRVNRTVPVS